jgi:hypothetical protein
MSLSRSRVSARLQRSEPQVLFAGFRRECAESFSSGAYLRFSGNKYGLPNGRPYVFALR